MARKRESKPNGPRRREKQRVKDRIAHAQDDGQRLGIIETTPEEALKPARVGPPVQNEQIFPNLISRAMRKGWEPTEEMKISSVDELDSIIHDREVPPQVRVNAIRIQQQGTVIQHSIDNPEAAGKAKGGINNKNEVTVVDLGELFRRVDEQRNGVTNGKGSSEVERRDSEEIRETGTSGRELPDSS